MTDARTAMKKQPSCNVALSLRFAREPEGGYTVTCKELPELITYGRTLDEALENAEDTFNAVVEADEEMCGRLILTYPRQFRYPFPFAVTCINDILLSEIYPE